jgi:UDP-N-acetylglucosamine 2-epimerase
VDVGANVIAGYQHERIVSAARFMHGKNDKWANPFGDGKAGHKVIELSLNYGLASVP